MAETPDELKARIAELEKQLRGRRTAVMGETAMNRRPDILVFTVPAKQLRCEVYMIPDGDMTGESAIECGAIALACADCGGPAGCEEHAVLCPRCGKPICDYCADEHGCVADEKERAA